MHAPGTIWRQSVRRVTRRSATYQSCHSAEAEALLTEAVRTANRLAYCAGIVKVRA